MRKLRQKRLHQWHVMLGYVTKDHGKEHYKLVFHNVTDDDFETGRQKYLKFGAGELKNRTELTSRNFSWTAPCSPQPCRMLSLAAPMTPTELSLEYISL